MSKYRNLSVHLAGLKHDRWSVSFKEIETVIENPLPRSAYQYQAWWSNQSGEGHAQSTAWKSAGWRTGELDMSRQHVTFFRDEAPSTGVTSNSDNPSKSSDRGLTIAEAKAGLASYFGVSPESVEIIIKG